MTNIEKELALEIMRPGGVSAAKFGLRFDRVVVGVLADLRSFVEATMPGNLAVLVTISAPIRLPARTVKDLKAEITTLSAAAMPVADGIATLHGNKVRIRLRDQSVNAPLRLIGFVHNSDSAPEPLLDLAEQWLRAEVTPPQDRLMPDRPLP